MKEVEQLSNQGRILRNENLPGTDEMLGSTGSPRSSHVLQVLLWTGFSGFIVGVFLNATWQVAVEPAQVISGVVDYPWQTAFYIYQVKTWTAIHQVCAFFLWCGVSEAALSIILSGLLTMLYFQGLGLCTLAFSRCRILAVAALRLGRRGRVRCRSGVGSRGPPTRYSPRPPRHERRHIDWSQVALEAA